MGVVAYAFLATRTPTAKRPQDERSFQIKYGEKRGSELHEIWQDPLSLLTTVLIGIDVRDGFFVAADPQMHNPTKFFIRLEFKDHNADEIKRLEWYVWERERRSSSMPAPVEVLVGGTQDSFLDLVYFERAAKGLAQGDRHLLAERRGDWSLVSQRSIPPPPAELAREGLHPLAREFELGADEILDLIASARRLKMAVRGWVAEEKLRQTLEATSGVTQCERLNIEGGADVLVRFRDRSPLTIECKNVLRKTNSDGLPRIDFQRTRAAVSDACSRYYAPDEFDIVAGCLHAVTERWDFRYALPRWMAPHRKCHGKLASNVVIGADWVEDPALVFEAAYAALSSNP